MFNMINMCTVIHKCVCVCVCVCVDRWLYESGGSSVEAAAGNDAGEEETETGPITSLLSLLSCFVIICPPEHLKVLNRAHEQTDPDLNSGGLIFILFVTFGCFTSKNRKWESFQSEQSYSFNSFCAKSKVSYVRWCSSGKRSREYLTGSPTFQKHLHHLSS